VQLSDINGDGHLDLLVFFSQASVKLSPRTGKARMTGWLKNSQVFLPAVGQQSLAFPDCPWIG
jgi:hypothetical protein